MIFLRILIDAPNHNFVKGFVITDCKFPFLDITERLLSYSQFSHFSVFSSVSRQYSVSVFEFEKKWRSKEKDFALILIAK